MTDRLFLRGLRIDCLIGRAEWERMVQQTVELDLDLDCDLRAVAALDEIAPGTVNTKALSKRLQTFVGASEYRMIETLAEEVCRLVLSEFPVARVRLRLSKPGALRGARTVGVALVRTPVDYR